MESIKADYFFAICRLARAGQPLEDFGIDDGLHEAIRWYLDGPPKYSILMYEELVKAVMDARISLVDSHHK